MVKRITSFIGWVGVALVLVAFAVVAGQWAGVEAVRVEWIPYARYLAWAGLACLLIYIAGQWREIGTSMERRQTRLGVMAASGVVIVLALLVAINYLASRRNYRWDLTEAGQFSLSDQTRQILQRLDAPVHVRVFDQPAGFDRFRDRLDEYAYQSDRVSVEYIDMDRQPIVANQNQVQAYGTVVFDYKGRTERVTSSEEQQLTNALIKVITGEERKVYFLSGHGEHETSGSDRDSYSAIASALGSENYTVESLVLLQQQTVPDDAALVIVAGPKTDLFPPEIDALRTYLERGGKLLLMVDPRETAGAVPLTNLVAFAREWAIEIGDNVVVDASGVGQLIGTDASVPVAARYPFHPITENFRLLTAYPLARSVQGVSGGVDGRTAQNFIESSRNSWGETNLEELATGTVEQNEGDIGGPVPLGAALSIDAPKPPAATASAEQEAGAAKAAATTADAGEGDDSGEREAGAGEDAAAEDGTAEAEDTSSDAGDEAPKPQTRIAVIGDSDFAANFALGIQGNRDLFLNTVNWLTQQENLISIRARDPEDRRITMTAGQQRTVTWFALLVLPVLIWGIGIYNWSRRRG